LQIVFFFFFLLWFPFPRSEANVPPTATRTCSRVAAKTVDVVVYDLMRRGW